MSDIFEACLEAVMDTNCITEGTFMAKMIEKAGEKKSDDDINVPSVTQFISITCSRHASKISLIKVTPL